MFVAVWMRLWAVLAAVPDSGLTKCWWAPPAAGVTALNVEALNVMKGRLPVNFDLAAACLQALPANTSAGCGSPAPEGLLQTVVLEGGGVGSGGPAAAVAQQQAVHEERGTVGTPSPGKAPKVVVERGPAAGGPGRKAM